MRKLLLPLVLAGVMITAACGGNGTSDKRVGDDTSVTTSPAATASASSSPAATASVSSPVATAAASSTAANASKDTSQAGNANSTAAGTNANNTGSEVDADSTNIEHISADEVTEGTIDSGRTENAFIGHWYAVSTTTENTAFSALQLTITDDGYVVDMSFDNYSGTTSYEGKYDLKDGVLTFDKNFLDCTAYFYKGDIHTLVLDSGTSLVFCEHLEQEREMR